jgi:hypothetical protein
MVMDDRHVVNTCSSWGMLGDRALKLKRRLS